MPRLRLSHREIVQMSGIQRQQDPTYKKALNRMKKSYAINHEDIMKYSLSIPREEESTQFKSWQVSTMFPKRIAWIYWSLHCHPPKTQQQRPSIWPIISSHRSSSSGTAVTNAKAAKADVASCQAWQPTTTSNVCWEKCRLSMVEK